MTTVTIKTIAETSGRDGPQWELKVTWPWTVDANQDTIWLDQKQFSKPTLGTQQVVVARKSKKRNKERVEYDGHMDWMWNWNIIEFGVDGSLPPNTTGNGHQQPQQGPPANPSSDYVSPESPPKPDSEDPPPKDTIQTRIELGMAFNQACALVAGTLGEDDTNFLLDDEHTATHQIRILRDELYHDVIQVPVAPPHYCYGHEQPRRVTGLGSWLHAVAENVWCVEGAGLLDGKGNRACCETP